MSLAQEMVDTYPGGLGNMPAENLVTCIDACFECAQTCTACADACLAEEEVGAMVRCIRLSLDCADICTTTGRIISRHTETDLRITIAQVQACLIACEACASECESHPHGHCENCAVACRRCAAACMELLDALGQITQEHTTK